MSARTLLLVAGAAAFAWWWTSIRGTRVLRDGRRVTITARNLESAVAYDAATLGTLPRPPAIDTGATREKYT